MSESYCFLQCGVLCTENDMSNITNEKWENMKSKSKDWRGLDKFGNLYESADWESGPAGKCIHKNCQLILRSKEKLEKAKKRKERADQHIAQQKEQEQEPTEESKPKRLRSSTGIIHDKYKCVWCLKPEDIKNNNTLSLIRYDHSWESFKRHTVILEDPQTRYRINCLIDNIGNDYVAAEIRYHRKCWNYHVKKYQKLSDDSKIPLMHHVILREAQTIFMDHVRLVIFEEHELRSLQSLLGEYKTIMSKYGFGTDGLKSSYVKEILEREFKDKIGFHARPRRNVSELVYDTSGGGSYIEAAILSMGVSDEQLVSNITKRIIQDVKYIGTVPWPPSVDELEESEELSSLLLKFVSSLKGKSDINSPKVIFLTSLLTQYITGKPTKSVINSSVTKHGITRSKEIIDADYKLGTGISYQDVLDLRDVWALHDLQRAENCPVEIAEGKPGISIIDNDDFQNDTLTGGGTSHRTNWLMIQKEACRLIEEEQSDRPANARETSIVLNQIASEMQKVQPYKTLKRGEPPVRDKPADNGKLKSTESQRKRSVIHALSRANNEGVRPEPANQKIPSLNGFQATLHPNNCKSKPYYHKSYDQPPNKTVVRDIMDKQVAIIAEKKMPYAFITGDQPVYTLLIDLKSENPDKYQSIIPFLGPFHTQCVMMAAIFKRYEGSELEEVLVQAGAVAAGSVKQALKGQHFRRGIRIFSLFYESLITNILRDKVMNLEPETKRKLEILRDIAADQETRKAAHDDLEEDEEITKLVDIIFQDMEDMGDMAAYWKDFLDMAGALLQSMHAIHSGNFDEYVRSVRAMLPWMLGYDRLKYGRWLPDFWSMLLNLPSDQFAFLQENFAQSLTGNPYSNMAWDMWIETTMNKGSKLKSGWLSILKNEKQLLVHSRNVNNVARIRAAHNSAAMRKSTEWKHAECNPKRIKLDEESVQNIVECFKEYGSYPFEPDNQELRTLQSGVLASQELIDDFKTANDDGEKQLESILKERVYSKQKSLHATIKKMNRKTFADASATKVPKSKHVKNAEMEQDALKSVINLVERSGVVKLEELLENRVTQESTSLFNPDGTYRKNVKSQLLQKINKDSTTIVSDYTAIIDMGMMWRLAMPETNEKSLDSDAPFKYKDFGKKVADTIVTRHPNANTIICVNDVYNHPHSTKEDERLRREKSIGQIPNEFFKPEDVFPSRKQFNKILQNPENKKRLQKFLFKALKDKAIQTQVEIIYSTGLLCQDAATGFNIEQLTFDHSEADTIMISIYAKLRDTGNRSPIVLDAADTDVYVSSSYASHQYPGDLLIRRGGDFVDCRTLFDESLVSCIIPFHVMTGCDANSGYYGKSKGTLFEKMKSSDRAMQQLQSCGDQVELTPECMHKLLRFTRELIYADPHSDTMAEARALKWRSQKNKSFCRLPPDEDTLVNHLKRANYLAYLLKHPSLREHPSPVGKGWEVINSIIKPVRYTKPALPDFIDRLNNDDVTAQDPVESDIEMASDHESDNSHDSDYDCDTEPDNDSVECGVSDNEYDDIDYSTDEDYSDIEFDKLS